MICGQHPGLCPHDVAMAIGSASSLALAGYIAKQWAAGIWGRIWKVAKAEDFVPRGSVCGCRRVTLVPYGTRMEVGE